MADAIANNAAFGIVCLTGVLPRGRPFTIDLGGVNRDIVLENDVVFGTVNANLRHYALAAEDFASAFEKETDDVKVVLDL